MPGKYALIIGNSRYDDSSLGRLRAPDIDVKGLEEVLKAPDIGQFDDVITLLNEGGAAVRKAVARFYDQRQRDDLLLLYFSGHGVKDEQGHLYLALRDTESTLLAGTAIETAFITGRMDRSFSKRQVLVLDCCHSGAFAYGAKAAQGVSVGTAEAFEGTGLGRAVLTATDSTQYAWEGDQIIGDAPNSLFTHFLIEGLKTGAADRDDDGLVTVDELYDYVREQVLNTTPRQTPQKWTYRQQGDIVVAQNPIAKQATLPPEIEEALGSHMLSLRLEAVRNLATLLRGRHDGRSRAALAALKDLSMDDSRKVANAAVEVLKDSDVVERRRLTEPHLIAARAAIERQQFVAALESLRRVAKLDAQAEGLAELVRTAEEGQADVQRRLAELALSERTDPEASASEAPPLPAKPDARAEPVGSPRGAAAAAAGDEPGAARAEAQPSDIFISYAREDRDKARALANVLTARGWKVWWDRKIAPGEAFDEVIERELGTCKCAIVLWSARSVHATWVRNEARRAARRKVLVPILIDAVETPLEFENLQAADLTSWKTAADHPEFERVFDRIQALSPIPYERLARAAVDEARREFEAGNRQVALARLEQFRPAHDLVSRAIVELRAEAERIERDRTEAERREAEAAQRQRKVAAEKTRLEKLVGRLDLDAAERALTAADRKFDRPAEFRSIRERLEALRSHADREQSARTAVEDARREFDAGRRQAALGILEQFLPAHELVTRALTGLRAEAERIEGEEGAEAAREAAREAEVAERRRELDAATAEIDALLERVELDAAELALTAAEKTFEHPAACVPLRERLDALRSQTQQDRLARNAVEDARREFDAGRHQAALASLQQFRPPHDLVTRALADLRAEAERVEREEAETARREAESAARQPELGAATAHIEELFEHLDLDAAEQALASLETTFEHPAECGPLREKLATLREQVQVDQLARAAVDAARREFDAGRHEAALASLEQFRPSHLLVTRALTELRARAAGIARARAEAARDAEAAARQPDPVIEEEAARDDDATVDADQQPRPWYASRLIQGAAAVLTLVVGTWLAGVWPGRTPAPRNRDQNPIRETPVSVPAGPSGRKEKSVQTASRETESQPQEQPPIGGAPRLPDAVPENPVIPDRPAGPAAGRGGSSAAAGRLESLRTLAREQWELGQRLPAWNAVVQGLLIDPRDPVLRALLTSMLREAQLTAQQAKQAARSVNADQKAEQAFDRAAAKERQADHERRTNKPDLATRSFWVAAEQFRAAADEARQNAEGEPPARPTPGNRTETAPAPDAPRATPPEQKPVWDEVAESELATQTVVRYEAALRSMRTAAVRLVYPDAPTDQLAKEFAAASSYVLKFQLGPFFFVHQTNRPEQARVPGHLIRDVVPKSGGPAEHSEKDAIIFFEKQRTTNTWVITGIQ